jgi:hypothetical protein
MHTTRKDQVFPPRPSTRFSAQSGVNKKPAIEPNELASNLSRRRLRTSRRLVRVLNIPQHTVECSGNRSKVSSRTPQVEPPMLSHLLLQSILASSALMPAMFARHNPAVASSQEFPAEGHSGSRLLQQSEEKAATAPGPDPAAVASNNTPEEADAPEDSKSRQNRFRVGDRRRIERWQREGTTGPSSANSSSGDDTASSDGEDPAGAGAHQTDTGSSITMTDSDDADGSGPESAPGSDTSNDGTAPRATASTGPAGDTPGLANSNSTGNSTADPAGPLALPTKVSLKSSVTAYEGGPQTHLHRLQLVTFIYE